MKIVKKNVLWLFLGMLFVFSSCVFYDKKNVKKTRHYIYSEKRGELNFPVIANDTLYSGSILFDDVAINNKDIAYDMAEVIVGRFFGDDCFKNELPINICLYNKSVWIIRGTVAPNKMGGAFVLILDKKTGGIIDVYHEK